MPRRDCFISGLEAQDVLDRDTIQMIADPPRGQDFRVDELVDRFTIELPAEAQLRYCQPNRTDATAEVDGVGRYEPPSLRMSFPAFR